VNHNPLLVINDSLVGNRSKFGSGWKTGENRMLGNNFEPDRVGSPGGPVV